MKNIITILLLTLSNFMLAQINFDIETILIDRSHIAIDPTSMLLVDLDNDNYKDLVLTSYEDTIMWYKNVNGNFSYFERKIISELVVDIPSSIASGDLNNDGLNDIIATSSSAQDKIVWFENLGNGNFSDEIIISDTINGPLAININDLDNDGDMDILTGGQNGTIILLENLNTGNFENPIIIYNGNSNTRKIKTADLNNDNLIDIISSHSNGILYWSKNLGNNNYDDKQFITGGSDNGKALDLIDVNEDGFFDIITAKNSGSSNNVRYILNQNGISFDNNNAIIIDNTIQEPYEISAKDIDNDGKKDIVVSFWANDNISWYKNLGNSSFSPKILITDNINNSKSFVIDDVDNDNMNDVITSSYPEEKVSLFKNQNSGNNFEETIINYWYGFPRDIKVGDLNNDGNNDIIIACDDLIWFENYGNTSFSSYKLISSIEDSSPFLDSIIFDLDSDGNNDIIGLRYDGIEIFTNQGNEVFSSIFYLYENLNGNLILEDIDGDSQKDLIVIIDDDDDDKIGWIKNNGDLSFGTLNVFSETSYGFKPNRITAGDIDNDGDVDVVISSKDYSRIQLMENDGTGNLSYSLIMESIGTDPISLEDVDNDGFLDIISGKSGIFWLKNNSGTFASTVTEIDLTSFSAGVTDFSFEDIDGNGFKDFIGVYAEAFNGNGGEIFYHLNTNSGFQDKVSIDFINYTLTQPRKIILEDINNDNKLDILTTYTLQSAASYYLNSSLLSVIEFEDPSSHNFKLFPIPFTTKLQWIFANDDRVQEVFIYDSLGKKLLEKNQIISSEIDLTSLPEGIYFIKFITMNNNALTRKIIKN